MIFLNITMEKEIKVKFFVAIVFALNTYISIHAMDFVEMNTLESFHERCKKATDLWPRAKCLVEQNIQICTESLPKNAGMDDLKKELEILKNAKFPELLCTDMAALKQSLAAIDVIINRSSALYQKINALNDERRHKLWLQSQVSVREAQSLITQNGAAMQLQLQYTSERTRDSLTARFTELNNKALPLISSQDDSNLEENMEKLQLLEPILQEHQRLAQEVNQNVDTERMNIDRKRMHDELALKCQASVQQFNTLISRLLPYMQGPHKNHLRTWATQIQRQVAHVEEGSGGSFEPILAQYNMLLEWATKNMNASPQSIAVDPAAFQAHMSCLQDQDSDSEQWRAILLRAAHEKEDAFSRAIARDQKDV